MKILKLISILSPLLWLNSTNLYAQTWPQGDGQIRIYNYHLNEHSEIKFRKNGNYIQAGLKNFEQKLRSRDSGEIIRIDPRLIDLLDHLQDRYSADTIEIISGYRSPKLNKALLKSGRKVSPRSLHMRGQAIDIHIDEVREETLRDYLLKLKLGGVGYYGSLDFVHVDVGPHRYWSDTPVHKRKLIGKINRNIPGKIISDKNEYLKHEEVKLAIQAIQKLKNIRIQKFVRGRWTELKKSRKVSFQSNSLKHKDFENKYGKFRIAFFYEGQSEEFHSNEFYFKKK